MVKKIVITVKPEHHEILARAADHMGQTISSWSRGVLLDAARGGVKADKAAHEAGVAERREKRQERKRVAAIEDQAWAELAKCQEALSLAYSSKDPEAIERAERARVAADSVALEWQRKREALEA